MGPYAEGDHRPCPQHHEDQDHCSPREEVLRLDRWLHPGFALHLPVHVDLKGGVRRVRCLHRPQEVLLESYLILSVRSAFGPEPVLNDKKKTTPQNKHLQSRKKKNPQKKTPQKGKKKKKKKKKKS